MGREGKGRKGRGTQGEGRGRAGRGRAGREGTPPNIFIAPPVPVF